jgi:hypothetical protein
MTPNSRFWVVVIAVAALVVLNAAFPRYTLTIGGQSNTIAYRFDRWNGRVEASHIGANPPASWLTSFYRP